MSDLDNKLGPFFFTKLQEIQDFANVLNMFAQDPERGFPGIGFRAMMGRPYAQHMANMISEGKNVYQIYDEMSASVFFDKVVAAKLLKWAVKRHNKWEREDV